MSMPLSGNTFGKLFTILLTDNGGEFANIFAFENNADGEPECRLFFCNPMHANQKARIEKNHSMLRDILPKGTSFDNLTQEHLNVIFSHINCVKRSSLNGKSAYDMFSFLYGQQAPALFDLSYIPPERVVQSPKLLKLLGINI